MWTRILVQFKVTWFSYSPGKWGYLERLEPILGTRTSLDQWVATTKRQNRGSKVIELPNADDGT